MENSLSIVKHPQTSDSSTYTKHTLEIQKTNNSFTKNQTKCKNS